MREVARMAAIYRDADVTIIAALAADAGEGFLHERACTPASKDAGDANPYLPFPTCRSAAAMATIALT